MKNKKTNLTAFLLLGIGFNQVYAQQATNASGGNASGSGGSVSYSVGQVVYTTNTGATGTVSQGVQQPYEISVVSGIEQAKNIQLSVIAYPNPTTDFLTLEVNDFQLSNLHFEFFDINGKLLQTQKITDIQTTIAMSHLASATYFVKVIEGKKEVKSFKIIKP